MNNNWHKKEKPLLGLTGLGGGVDGLAVVGAAAKPKYIDEVFSNYLYDGNQSARSITNNIDLTKGGLVWTKRRSGSGNHTWYDTVRGATYYIRSNLDNAQGNDANTLTSFNSDGFSLGTDTTSNDTGEFVSWSLRTRENFFDIVEYTGTGSVQNISHNLKSVPGCIIIKKTNGVEDWNMYHRSLGNTKYMKLNKTNGVNTATSRWNDTTPTSSVFTVGTAGDVNGSGDTYIAYLFAHHDGTGDFGDSEDKDVIYCGSYTSTNGSAITVNGIGWEPQWLMLKNSYGRNANWAMLDTMRGQSIQADDHPVLSANETYAEQDVGENGSPVPISKGFALASGSYAEYNYSSDEIIYIAFRMPDGVVGKPAEAGTDVLAITAGLDTPNDPNFVTNFVTDMAFWRNNPASGTWWLATRKTGTDYLSPNLTSAANTNSHYKWDHMNGWYVGPYELSLQFGWNFKRGQGFDVLSQTMTGSGYQFWNHTCMGQAPEMMWMKKRSGTADWEVWHKDLNGGTASYNWSVHLNEYEPEYQPGGGVNYMWGLANPPDESQVIVLDSYFGGSGDYTLLLFSSVTGISKVGSYSGSSSDQTISTGFQPRFVIIRRIDTQQDWVLLDTVRGWAQGANDPRMEINQDTAPITNTDFGYPTTDGFVLEGNLTKTNANGGDFIYYAHA
jgi:hypothetical protein